MYQKITIIALAMTSLIFCGCTSFPYAVPIKDYYNSGQFTYDNVEIGGIYFVGSTKKSYGELGLGLTEVMEINNKLRTYLVKLYGENNIYLSNANDGKHRFIISYTINKNIISKNNMDFRDRTCYESSREMEIIINVAESNNPAPVWGGSLSSKQSKQHCNRITEVNTGDPAETFVGIVAATFLDTVREGILGTYPDPPSVDRVSGDILRDFYRAMPGKAPKDFADKEASSTKESDEF